MQLIGLMTGWGTVGTPPPDRPPRKVPEHASHLLAHGVKEFLVERAVDWPGVNSVRAILEGKPLVGYWFNRKAEYAARNRGKEYGRLTYATEETFVLSPLPCWAHLSPEQYRERVAALVAEIEAEAEAIRREKGIPVLGIKAILQQNPHTEPNRTKKSPAPRFHASALTKIDPPLLGKSAPPAASSLLS